MDGNSEFPVVPIHLAILLRLTSSRKGFNGFKKAGEQGVPERVKLSSKRGPLNPRTLPLRHPHSSDRGAFSAPTGSCDKNFLNLSCPYASG